MTLYPEVQRKAREEIDRVVGHNRLPNYNDRADLPYVEALLKEVLRWNPVAPLALPHRVTLDDVYEGYLIPAGAIIFANTWGIFKDPSLYEKPDEFNPERFLKNADIPDPKSFAFGYGRRVCPGQHLADASLFLTIVSTLALFEITYATDEKTGKPIIPEPNYKAGVICHPEEYKCSIKPRFSEAELLQHIGK
jgi:cytochrome P450